MTWPSVQEIQPIFAAASVLLAAALFCCCASLMVHYGCVPLCSGEIEGVYLQLIVAVVCRRVADHMISAARRGGAASTSDGASSHGGGRVRHSGV